MKKIVHFTKARLLTWPGSFTAEFVEKRKAYFKTVSWRDNPYEPKCEPANDALKFD